MKIRVPATSANLGPGFDSVGLAVNRYLTIDVLETSDHWLVEHQLGAEIPSDEGNLLVQTALSVAPAIQPQHIKMVSDIPLTRGLGSSSSVIVAGIELANRLGQLNLTQQEKLALATEIEGHPDNVAPAIAGDFVVASYVDGEVEFVKHYFPDCDILAYIPDHELSTEKSRQALPKELSYKEAVQASSLANVMIAAVVKGNLPLAGKMMEQDRWHEKYRLSLVPHLGKIRGICHEYGGYGCYLSGAGPTVLVLSPEDKTPKIRKALQNLEGKAAIEQLVVDREGVQVF